MGGVCRDRAYGALMPMESLQRQKPLFSPTCWGLLLDSLPAAHPDLGPLSHQDRTKCLTDGIFPLSPPPKKRKTQRGGREGKERNQREINVFGKVSEKSLNKALACKNVTECVIA